MTFDEVLTQVIELLRRDGRVSYRALKRRFNLDNDYLDDLKAEIIKAKKLAVDEDGEVLVWIGATPVQSSEFQVQSYPLPPAPSTQPFDASRLTPHVSRAEAERRQLTVMFCDLVGSTALSVQLDPEDYRAVVQRYHQICDAVIRRYEGHVAQHLGDGLLVYFGYPTAHEDDARRAVRAGLEIIVTLPQQVPSPLVREGQGEGAFRVRIGIHTGLVVVGDIGAGGRTELLALGETPNLAARIQGLAEPNTVLLSAATQRLVDGQFECQPFGSHLVKGIDAPIAVYHVQSERQNACFAG
jgi:class 3 adenylate cyclase